MKTKAIKKGLVALFKKISQNLFLVLLFLLLLDAVLGWLFFWKYYLKSDEANVQITQPVKLNQALKTKTFSVWEEKEAASLAAKTKTYPDPFNLALKEPPETETPKQESATSTPLEISTPTP